MSEMYDDEEMMGDYSSAPMATSELPPEIQMALGNHSIGIFKDGKLIAADADVLATLKSKTPRTDASVAEVRRIWFDTYPLTEGDFCKGTDSRKLECELAEAKLAHSNEFMMHERQRQRAERAERELAMERDDNKQCCDLREKAEAALAAARPSEEAVLCAGGWFGMSGVNPTPALVDMLATELLRIDKLTEPKT